jgi:hypothetical protein
VRLPAKHARRLDRAAAALPAHKKDLIAGLVERYVDPETPQGLEELRVLAAAPRRVIIEADESPLTVGQHSFRPSAPPEVLDIEQTAELLGVDQEAIAALAASGELPGREIAGQWRFLRRAVLDWLARTE